MLHRAHGVWPAVSRIPTLASLAVIVAVLATVTVTSPRTFRHAPAGEPVSRAPDEPVSSASPCLG